MHTLTIRIFTGLFIAMLLAGCSLAAEVPGVSPPGPTAGVTTPSPTHAAETAVVSPSPSPTAAGPRPSPTAVQTETAAILPTETRVPPLPRAEAEASVIELLRDNGGCRLPCFWDIVPGKTSHDTFTSYFQTFHEIGGHQIAMPRQDASIKISAITNYDEDPHAAIRRLDVFMNADREVKIPDGTYDEDVFDNPYLPEYIHYYSLANLLATYGPPENAYVGVDLLKYMGYSHDLFHLYLDYSGSGWVVGFIMEAKQEGDFFAGCPAQAFTDLELWAPDDEALAKDKQAKFDEAIYYLPIEEATSLSLEEFYQRYTTAGDMPCVQVPADLWLGEE